MLRVREEQLPPLAQW